MSKITLYRPAVEKKEFAIVVLLAVLLGLAEFVGWTRVISAQVEAVLNPIQAFETQLVRAFSQPARSFFTGYHSAEELRELKIRYAAQIAELDELDRLRRENTQLRQMLENPERPSEDVKIAAPVVSLAYPAVAAGSQNGVNQGEMVTFQNTLLGVVTQVSQHQSRIALLTRKDSVPVLAKTNSGVQGIVTGNGKQVILTEVPHGLILNKGERVVTVGQEGIRRDVLIGVIGEVMTRPSAPTQTAVVQQQLSFFDVPAVEIW